MVSADDWLHRLQLYYDNMNSDDDFRTAYATLLDEVVSLCREPTGDVPAVRDGPTAAIDASGEVDDVLAYLETLDRLEPIPGGPVDDGHTSRVHGILRVCLATFGHDQYLPEDFGREDLRHSLSRHLVGSRGWTSGLPKPDPTDVAWARYQERRQRMQPAIEVVGFASRRRLLVTGDRPGFDHLIPDARSMTLTRSRRRAAAAPRWRLKRTVWLAWRLYRATRGDNASVIADEENRLMAERHLPPRLEYWLLDSAKSRAYVARERARRRWLADAGQQVDYPPPRTFEEFLMIPPIDMGPWDLGIGRRRGSVRDEADEFVGEMRQRLPTLSTQSTTVAAVQGSIRDWRRRLSIRKPHPSRGGATSGSGRTRRGRGGATSR